MYHTLKKIVVWNCDGCALSDGRYIRTRICTCAIALSLGQSMIVYQISFSSSQTRGHHCKAV